MAVRCGAGSDLGLHLAARHEVDQRRLEGLHLEELAVADRVGDLVGTGLADQIGDARVRDHHLDGGDPAAAGARQQPLRDDTAQNAGHDRPDLLLLGLGEELDHPPDRLGGVDRVHRREDEMARLGCLERGLSGFRVAQLADQDRVRVLPEGAAKRLGEARGVEPHLALVHDREVVGVEDLDRILDRDDVRPAGAVDPIDHGGERRRLARAGGAGDEDETPLLLGERLDSRRQMQLLEGRDGGRDDPQRHGDGAALAKDVDAESRQAFGRVGEVEISRFLKLVVALRRERGDRAEDRVEIALGQARNVESLDAAVAPDEGCAVELQVDVGRPEVDGTAQQRVQVHRLPMSAASRYAFRNAPHSGDSPRQVAVQRRRSRERGSGARPRPRPERDCGLRGVRVPAGRRPHRSLRRVGVPQGAADGRSGARGTGVGRASVPRVVDPDLNDIRVGELEGKTLADYREWKHGRGRDDPFPGGESLNDAARRYADAFERLLARPEDVVLVVCHEIPVRYVVNAAAGSAELDRPLHDIPNATPYLFDPDGLRRAVDRIRELAGNA